MRRPSSRVTAGLAACVGLAAATLQAGAQEMPDVVSRTALRVCSDPANLPFSDRQKQGFENKIADIVGNELKEPVRYFWAPSGPGFVRNTLNSGLCDVVMGDAVGAEMLQSTNPYYRSTYVLVAPKGSPLNGIEALEDPRLKGHRLGVFAATPPVDVMLAHGLMEGAVVYPLIVDHRYNSPLKTILDDFQAKKIDAAIVWGPLIGQSVKQSDGALVMTPLLKDAGTQGFSYRITFGVRHDETDWKHKLEGVIRARKADINKVLEDYNVPLLDNAGHLISQQEATSAAAPKLEPAGDRPGRRGASPTGAAPFKMPGPPPSNAPGAAQ